MVELLFILGLIGLLVVRTFEFLAALQAAPTLLAAAGLVPLLAVWDYTHTLHALSLEGLVRSWEHRGQRLRPPVPPERTYWLLHGGRLRRQLGWLAPIAVIFWALALWFPARLAWQPLAVAGWVFGAVAIDATARFLARSVLYWRAAQWFDEMRPGIVGFYRRTMYRLSENPEFLGDENPRERERADSIY
ncbi:MAG: hypothetical protein JO295_02520 [Verrucomicrobia bacterium]|nr:hypothetical protein [Verrucomicrobiota bacterium]